MLEKITDGDGEERALWRWPGDGPGNSKETELKKREPFSTAIYYTGEMGRTLGSVQEISDTKQHLHPPVCGTQSL